MARVSPLDRYCGPGDPAYVGRYRECVCGRERERESESKKEREREKEPQAQEIGDSLEQHQAKNKKKIKKKKLFTHSSCKGLYSISGVMARVRFFNRYLGPGDHPYVGR